MGFTYPELTILGMSAIRCWCLLLRNAQIYQREIIGRLRKVNRLGPFGSKLSRQCLFSLVCYGFNPRPGASNIPKAVFANSDFAQCSNGLSMTGAQIEKSCPAMKLHFIRPIKWLIK